MPLAYHLKDRVLLFDRDGDHKIFAIGGGGRRSKSAGTIFGEILISMKHRADKEGQISLNFTVITLGGVEQTTRYDIKFSRNRLGAWTSANENLLDNQVSRQCLVFIANGTVFCHSVIPISYNEMGKTLCYARGGVVEPVKLPMFTHLYFWIRKPITDNFFIKYNLVYLRY